MVIVWGATGGLGSALLDEFDGDGCVGVLGRTMCDVTSEDEIEKYFSTGEWPDEPLHIVYAAGASKNAMLHKSRVADIEEILRVNLIGPMLIIKHAQPLLKVRPLSSVTFVGSVTATTGVPGTAAYSASKAGLHGLVRTAAKELARFNVRVNCLDLGYFDAGLIKQVPPEALTGILAQVPLGRLGTLNEFCHAVRFMVENTFLTGAVVRLNGGLV